MLKRILPVLAFLIPLTALALEIQPGDFYDDVRPNAPEAAGINLLTRENIVQGYGNRIFGTTRLINRAEFLKIAILATPPDLQPTPENGVGCFRDVQAGQWFAPYVCAAKRKGIVRGNADPNLPEDQWFFRPEETVTYDAALKMLTLLFDYDIPNVTGTDWAEPYYQAAAERGTDYPSRIRFDTPLTRGMAARLAGAFLAESEGQLEAYHMAEAGSYLPPSSSSSSVSSSPSSSSSSVSSSVSSSSSSSQAASLYTLPVTSHFLITGKPSDAVAEGVIRSQGETARISAVQVKVFSEVRSMEKLELTTATGMVLATLTRRITTDVSDYKQIFETQIIPEKQPQIPADTDVPVYIRAVVRSTENGGFSEELFHMRLFNLTLRGESTNETKNIPINGPFKKHQTAFGRIHDIRRESPETAVLGNGTGVVVGSFAFSGTTVAGKTLTLTQLTFTEIRTGSVMTSEWTLVNRATGAGIPCTTNNLLRTVSCLQNLRDAVGILPQSAPLILDLKAKITGVTAGSSLQVNLATAGSPEELGSVEWTDGGGSFRWVEGPSPLVTGTRHQ